ncbi:MAG: ABC transporter permease [Candidatus Dormibacteraeota bacterium]|nr:ABC transporter permease [Candidatus Dormibacteraeota bacterium]
MTRARRYLIPGLVLLGVLVLWQIGAVIAGHHVRAIPPPTMIVVTLVQNWALFVGDLQYTLVEAAAGFVIATVVAIGLALVFVRSRAAEHALYNVAVAAHSIPFIAIVPILVIWLGNGYSPKIAVAALASFFPILVNATRGLRAVDRETMDLLYVLDARWWQVVRKVRWPTALPYLFAAFKIGAPSAVLGATIGEWIGSQTGLGYRILSAMFNFDPALLWATMVVSALAALAGFLLFEILERLTVGRWASGNAVGS